MSKIGAGGSPVGSLGNIAIADPDTSVLDVAGTIAGVPGSLLIGGLHAADSLGRISAILPDNSVITLFDNGSWSNVVEMKFDANGRLLFTGAESRSIWSTTGGAPAILATLPGSVYPTYLTIAPNNSIAVAGNDGVIRIYAANGTLMNASLATFGSLGGLEYGPGSAFGTDLYALDSALGTLVRVSPTGVKTTLGSGFATGVAPKDLAFGPGPGLYVSINTQDRVLRISAPWTNLGGALAGSQGFPQLAPLGPATASSVTTFPLSSVQQASFGALVLGVARIDLPIFGGVLVPKNDLVLAYATSVAFTASKALQWPSTMPAGIPIYAQAWTLDAGAVQGLSASNACETLSD